MSIGAIVKLCIFDDDELKNVLTQNGWNFEIRHDRLLDPKTLAENDINASMAEQKIRVMESNILVMHPYAGFFKMTTGEWICRSPNKEVLDKFQNKLAAQYAEAVVIKKLKHMGMMPNGRKVDAKGRVKIKFLAP